MKKTATLLFALLAIALSLRAAPIPLDVKKTVVFIYRPINPTNAIPDGTGFLVGVPSPKDTNDMFIYLVTAKHVLRNQDKSWLPSVSVRVNRRDGTSQQIFVSLVTSGTNKNVFMHDDQTVDIAVIPFAPDHRIFDYLVLPQMLLPNEADFKSLNIQEGSDVFFTGMFVHHLGTKHNIPIVRFGKVALLSEEKINWDAEDTDLYLVEASAYGGNSGSPVFFQIGAERAGGLVVLAGGPVIKLAGVMKGHYNDEVPVKDVSTSTNQAVFPNLGISAVVPSYRLQEILLSKELKQQREK